MKKIFLVLYILFSILTFCGAGYVIFHKGTVNAGYAVVPMLFAMICSEIYRSNKVK